MRPATYCLRSEGRFVVDMLDNDLKEADPAARLREDEVAPLILTIARALPSQAAQRRRWWKNWRITVPVGMVGVLALTGGAIAVPFILGDESGWVDMDASIPIEYVTESGVAVSCKLGVHVRSDNGRTAEDDRVAKFLAEEDWTGIGQEVYDHAIANPVSPQEGEVWTDDTPELRDGVSFKLALTTVVMSHLPPVMQGTGFASTDTCTGPFR